MTCLKSIYVYNLYFTVFLTKVDFNPIPRTHMNGYVKKIVLFLFLATTPCFENWLLSVKRSVLTLGLYLPNLLFAEYSVNLFFFSFKMI